MVDDGLTKNILGTLNTQHVKIYKHKAAQREAWKPKDASQMLNILKSNAITAGYHCRLLITLF